MYKAYRFREKSKKPKILPLTLNNFFSTHGIYEDVWDFISTRVSKVSTKIQLCRSFCYWITIFMPILTGPSMVSIRWGSNPFFYCNALNSVKIDIQIVFKSQKLGQSWILGDTLGTPVEIKCQKFQKIPCVLQKCQKSKFLFFEFFSNGR